MAERNTIPKVLESWKQIAAYLERSERTVRRWEAAEGLPVHRRGHQRQDTVFAHKHEIDVWSQKRTRPPGNPPKRAPVSTEEPPRPASGYLQEHDRITRVMHLYVAGARAGNAALMRPAFHPEATISGYCQGVEYTGSIDHVFDWIDANGPSPGLDPRFARIEIVETIAVVHLEGQGWSGKLAGAVRRTTDVFTLLQCDGEWKITHKLFHWHDA